ncbi:conserved hypothetical protein [Planktothrix serta PCC 8927]|uniref:Uncharacterized protein n=1 Tax=Planktothrix serta PCC 8927 TaxID=671068 RepID=A0A7Z9BSB7_9CYAN|nr:hypothetical protein [Planktothrix serta]VXD21841.1 conserved hypothetical protein [Planktothrix serta PCC 8927]
MTITVTGTIERKGFGFGTWALVSDNKTYELHNPPSDLQKSGLRVTVQGQVRDDVMTLAMVGPVLQIESFETA